MEGNKKKILGYVSMLFGLLALLYGFVAIVPEKSNWLQNLAVFSSTIIVSVVILILTIRIRGNRQEDLNGVYVSYTDDYEEYAQQLVGSIKKRVVIEGEKDIRPGTNIEKEAKRYIRKCSLCFIIIGHKISPQQKIEIKEILNQNKPLIPIRISNDVKIPSNLRNTKSVLLNDYIASIRATE